MFLKATALSSVVFRHSADRFTVARLPNRAFIDSLYSWFSRSSTPVLILALLPRQAGCVGHSVCRVWCRQER